jgi:NADP-dependent 3-hydroxy acid dehydrogenase YdfG
VQQELGGANILVNNAGVMLTAPFASDQREEHRRMVETNLLGAMTATEVFLDQLRANVAAIQITNQRPRTSRLWLRTQSVSAAIDPLPEFLSVRELRPFIVTPLLICTTRARHWASPRRRRNRRARRSPSRRGPAGGSSLSETIRPVGGRVIQASAE